MKRIRLIKNWDYPNLFRQSPQGDGIWEDIQVTEEAIETCDYVLVLNHVTKDTVVLCPKENIWLITQEPPVVEYEWLRKGFSQFGRVYTQDLKSGYSHIFPSMPATPWWVGKNYSELKAQTVPDKPLKLSWIMSNKAARSGHQMRLAFLEKVQQSLDFDLWGRGFRDFDDKWTALEAYQYSIAIENESADYYWTEKLSDVLLAWGLPIYYGAPNITDFLPSEAIIWIDIHKPDEAIAIIEETIATQQWEKRLEAIAYARQLILDKWQLFPYLKALIDEFEQTTKVSRPKAWKLRKTNQFEPKRIARLKGFVKDLLRW